MAKQLILDSQNSNNMVQTNRKEIHSTIQNVASQNLNYSASCISACKSQKCLQNIHFNKSIDNSKKQFIGTSNVD